MTIDSTYGVPTVAVHTHTFERVVRSVAEVSGMPGMNIRFGLVEITRLLRTTPGGASLIVAASNAGRVSAVVFCWRATAEGAASTAMTATVDRQR